MFARGSRYERVPDGGLRGRATDGEIPYKLLRLLPPSLPARPVAPRRRGRPARPRRAQLPRRPRAVLADLRREHGAPPGGAHGRARPPPLDPAGGAVAMPGVTRHAARSRSRRRRRPSVDAIEEIDVEMSIEAASVFRLKLGIAQTDLGDWTCSQEDLFRPLVPVTVRVGVGASPIPEALINGYVSDSSVTYSDEPGGSTLEVTGLDATHLMNLEEKVMPWPNLPDAAIAAAIFGQYALVPHGRTRRPPSLDRAGGDDDPARHRHPLPAPARAAQRLRLYVQPEPVTGLDQGFFQPAPAASGSRRRC